jgi:putative membrane protein
VLLWRWNFDPALLLALGLLPLAYSWDVTQRGIRRAEIAAFAAAWLLLFMLFVSPLCAWSSSLFSVRVTHHIVLVTMVAPLVVLARPGPWGMGRIPVFFLHAAVLWVWHLPAAYEVALSNSFVFWTMQLSLLGSGILLWQRVLAMSTEPGSALLGLVGTVIQMGLLGALITFAPQPLYEPHLATTAPWGLSPLEDQQVAGLIMWLPAMIPYLLAGLWLTTSLLASSQGALTRPRL